ncbi:MAG: hypothetical protein GEV03_15340 [Streptosporangiales bacterium]|nr:hypothetical protein [Streptosporangiales bacterium]
MGRVEKAVAAGIAALVAAAVATELRKPPDQRAWHGRVVGVPYDLRPPTPGRVRAALWDPTNDRILIPHVFGVGWSINFAAIFRRLSGRRKILSRGRHSG